MDKIDLGVGVWDHLGMAKEHSYRITRSNNRTQDAAVRFLLKTDKRFVHPDKASRKKILELLKINKRFARAFDLLHIGKYSIAEDGAVLTSAKGITLIELKTTRKKLKNNPKGFFFGATENEFKLARKLGKRFKFCFVSLHPESRSCAMMTLGEMEKMIKTKRVQHQINL